MEGKFCQSCGMPMEGDQAQYGTNADGSQNGDYCLYCYKDGDFTGQMSMQEMIEFCLPHVAQANPALGEAGARKMMEEFFPQLLRWKTAG